MKVKRYIIGFFFLFWLLYLEPVKVGPLTISQLWKIPFLGYLIVFVLMNKVHHPAYVTVGYLRGFKTVLNGGMLRNPVTEIIDFTRYMIIPLIFDWINLKVKNKALLDIYLLRLSAFILLSGIPFLIGILPPLGTVQEFQGDVLGFIGLFQTPKNASTSIAISLLIITFYFKTDSLNKQEKLFYRICILIGIIQLYLTFVRTGYVMFVVGLIVLYLPQKITFKELRPFLYVLVLVLIIFITLLQTNQAFYERIFDIRGNRTTNLGSGRLILWAASLDMWLQMNTIEKFFGIGFGGLKTSMNDYIGKSLDAHSEFFTQLVSNGIIGLTLTIIYVLNLINLLRIKRKSPFFRLGLTALISYLPVLFFARTNYFVLEILLAIIFVKIYNGNK